MFRLFEGEGGDGSGGGGRGAAKVQNIGGEQGGPDS